MIPVPGWVLGLLILLSLPTVVLILGTVWSALREPHGPVDR